MNIKLKKGLSALPALIVMTAIFIFSSKTADQSSATSDPITECFVRIYEIISGPYPDEIRIEKFSFFSMLVRKAAHMSIYALLSFTVSFHLITYGFRHKKILLLSVLISFLYACTDEFHQQFVDGRAGMITDVMIDTSGAFLGALFFIAFTAFGKRFFKRSL